MAGGASTASVSLIDEARSLEKAPGYPCLVANALEVVGDELRVAIDSDVTAAALSEALKKRNVYLPAATITRHRRHGCKCR